MYIWERKRGQYQPMHIISSYNIGNLLPLLLKWYRSENNMVIFWTTGYFADQNGAILPTAYTQVILILFSTCISCATTTGFLRNTLPDYAGIWIIIDAIFIIFRNEANSKEIRRKNTLAEISKHVLSSKTSIKQSPL